MSENEMHTLLYQSLVEVRNTVDTLKAKLQIAEAENMIQSNTIMYLETTLRSALINT